MKKDYEALQKEVYEKIEQAKKLLKEANALVPKAKIIHPELEDIGKLPDGFEINSIGFYKAGAYDDGGSKYARDIADLDSISSDYKNSLYTILADCGWSMSSIGC